MTNSGNEPPLSQEPDPQPSDPERLPPHGDPVAPPGWGQQQPGYGQPAYGQPVYGQPQYGQPHYGQPPYGQPPYTQAGFDPMAPYGRDPRTGEILSDKSKLAAGLLQLLLPFIGICGVGRLYAGNLAIGLIQLLGMFLGYLLLLVLIGFIVVPAIWLWTVIDGIILLSGNPRDGQGRPLRA